MHAIQITEQGGPEVLHLVELPVPTPGPGQVLIEIAAASVNFSDIMRRRGSLYPFPTPLPFVPGSEVAGTVVALGAGVEGPPMGTPVFAAVGEDGSSGYAQYALAGASGVIPVPPGLTASQAAGLVVAGTTAALVLDEVAGLSENQTVLVPAAAGGVGTFAVQLAKTRGATVIAAAGSAAKREAALALGADHVVESTDKYWGDAVRATCPHGVDVVIEIAGGRDLATGLGLLAPFGHLVVTGMASGTPGVLDADALNAWLYAPSLGQRVSAFNLGLYFGLRPDRAVAALSDMVGRVASGRIQAPPVTEVPLADAAHAHRLLEERRAIGKVVLVP